MEIARTRRRLVLWNLGALSFAVALVVVVALALEARSLDVALDHDLDESAARAAERLVHVMREQDDDDDIAPGDEHGTLVFARLRRGGLALQSPPRLPSGFPREQAIEAAFGGRRSKGEIAAGDHALRWVCAPVTHEGQVVGAVQVARSTAESRRSLERSAIALGATGGLGLLLALPLGLLLASRAMQPILDALERQRRFLADASHELRTPVAVLRARADALAASDPRDDELARLRKDAAELSALLTDLLDLARIDASRLPLRAEPFPIGDVAEELGEQFAPLARQRGLSLDVHATPLFARADLARTRQILRALLDNALGHARSLVSLRVAPAQGVVALTVQDDGPGIAPADLPHVFDPFFRSEQARAQGRGGAGLGLAIAAELARLMNGSLSARSQPGQGASFTLTLPAA